MEHFAQTLLHILRLKIFMSKYFKSLPFQEIETEFSKINGVLFFSMIFLATHAFVLLYI